MAKITYLWHRFIEQLKNPIVLVVIGFIAVGIWALWLDSQYIQLGINPRFFPESILINLAPELAGIAVGVLSIGDLGPTPQNVPIQKSNPFCTNSKYVRKGATLDRITIKRVLASIFVIQAQE
jgi:hypothetical protein